MKFITYILITILGLTGTPVNAQSQYKDTSVSFRVFGVCVQCKHRIEKALKINGVQSASWDVDSKMLSVRYVPETVSLDQLHKTIAAAGHDTEKEKATDEAYKALPECCHYR